MNDSVPLDDRGLLLGDGLFETVLCRRGELALWDRHAARMQAGAEALGLPVPDLAEMERTCREAVMATGLAQARAAVRLTLTAGSGGRGLDRPDPARPRLLATAAASVLADRPLNLVTARTRRNDQSAASRWKTLAYLDNVLARREAVQAGADEAVMLNTRGEAACAAAANLFWIADGRLSTPALDCGVLDGTMRREVIARAGRCGLACEEVRSGAAALEAAQAVFVTNSLVGVRAVSSLDGRALSPHRAVAALQAALADLL